METTNLFHKREDEIGDRYKGQQFTLNVTYLHSSINNKPPAPGRPRPPFSSRHRDRFTTLKVLKQFKTPSDNVDLGRKFAVKIPHLITCSPKLRYFMSIVLSVLAEDLKNKIDLLKDSVADSIIHFEIFDEQEQVVFAPMDLLHPISFDYESNKYSFIANARNNPYTFEDAYSKFVVMKAKSDYTSLERFLATTLNIYTARLDRAEAIDSISLRSIYAGLPVKEQYCLEQFRSCRWESSLTLFTDISRDDRIVI